MKNIIIGIHGLKNKPVKELLEKWWKLSILDGLHDIGYSKIDFDFELVYWADLEYERPLDPKIKDSKNPLYLAEPYYKNCCQTNKDHKLKREIFKKIEINLEKIFLHNNGFGGLDKLADASMKYMFADLDAYYHGNCKVKKNLEAKKAFRKRLAEVLKKNRHKKILLIGHSMGSIIAYDTLTQNLPNFPIETFVTLGSPLGVPIIIKKILTEQHKEITPESCPQTPEKILLNWYNFSDLNDKIAMNFDLADDFSANGQLVKPVDIVVTNNYEYANVRNPHKVYGYLQQREVAKVIADFLDIGLT